MKKYIIALDQGTTSSRAVLVDQSGVLTDTVQQEFTQHFPQPGWVEHDPLEIISSQFSVLQELVKKIDKTEASLAGIGITNQRETTLLWNRKTGKPLYNAIVWQDKRTASLCEQWKKEGLSAIVKEKTGLLIDAYFSASKIRWILDNVAGARALAEEGTVAFGTVDSWLIWNLTGGSSHVTDFTNASRTMLFNINTGCWDEDLLKAFDIPEALLPEVKPSSGLLGEAKIDGLTLPISGCAGDQQAALFGQGCFTPGSVKNTYGTGCFMLMHTGTSRPESSHGLLTTIAWNIDGVTAYALEGSVFIAGAAIQWLRDGLQLIEHAGDSEKWALEAGDSHEVYVVPAFAGLGAPYWDMYARGAIFGLTRDTDKAQLIKATLESLAYQTCDVLDAMSADAQVPLNQLFVDGGACANDYLMQFQADLLDVKVERPKIIESTALGAAGLAGLSLDFWDMSAFRNLRKVDKCFTPHMPTEQRQALYHGWKKAVQRTLNWSKE